MFDQFRVQKLEQPAPQKVRLILDQAGAVNYEDFDNNEMGQNLKIEAYIGYLGHEIKQIKE